MSSNSGIVVTPSVLGSYFHTHCQLHLQHRVHHRTPAQPHAETGNNNPTQQRGIDWEDLLVAHLKSTASLTVANADDALRLQATLTAAAQTLLNGDIRDTVVYLHHCCFVPPASFMPHFAQHGVRLGTCETDLLRLERLSGNDDGSTTSTSTRILVTVIDAKSSTSLKLSHQVQIVYYYLVIASILRQQPPSDANVDFVLAANGEVWRPPPGAGELSIRDAAKVQVDVFPLEPLQSMLVLFLNEQLVDLVTSPTPDWHFQSSCATCEFREECRANAVQQKRLSSIPYLSAADRHWLLAQMHQGPAAATALPEIEDLAGLLADQSRAAAIAGPNADASARNRLERILHRSPLIKADRASKEDPLGPVLASVRNGKVSAIGKSTLLLPRSEDVSVFVSLSLDALRHELIAWGVLVVDNAKQSTSTTATGTRRVDEPASDFVAKLTAHLAGLLNSFADDRARAVQFYTWSPADTAVLLELLVGAACSGAPVANLADSAQVCVAGLVDNSLATFAPIQPTIALGMASPSSNKTAGAKSEQKVELDNRVNELIAPIQRLSVHDDEDAKQGVLTSALERQSSRPLRVLSLLDAICSLVVLPVPGYYRLSDCAQHLGTLTPTPQMDSDDLAASDRLNAYADILAGLRRHLGVAYTKGQLEFLLLSTAGPVQLPQIARYNHDIIRRVSFVEKYELLHTWRTLRAERMASTSNLERAIIVEYVKYENRQRIFKVVQGNELVERVDPQAEKKFNVYTYIISPLSEETKADGVPSYLQFLDAQYHSQSKLEPPIEHLALAEISLTNETADGLFVGVNIEGKGVALAVRSRYVLRQRSYDKNTSRIVSALGLIDAEKPHPQDPPLGVLVVRSAQDQESWGRRAPEPGLHSNLDILSAAKRLATLYTTLRGLESVQDVAKLCARADQTTALNHMLSRRLQIVWGPPGTGKTHFLGLSILRLIGSTGLACEDTKQVPIPPVRVLVAAFTHTAIDNVLERVQDLLQITTSIPNHPTLDVFRQVKVQKLETKITQKDLKALLANPFIVVGATVHAIAEHRRYIDRAFDLLIIDEGSQLPMSMAMIAMDQLKTTGRLLICGDPMQLPPIRKASYPSSSDAVPVHSSVLACLLPNVNASGATSTGPEEFVDMLEETMRMNQQLTNFTTRLYRGRLRRSGEGPSRHALRIRSDGLEALSPYVPGMIDAINQQNLVTINLSAQAESIQTVSMEALVKAEARVVSNLAVALIRNATWPAAQGADKLYIVTPHRLQRAVIKQLLIQQLTTDQLKDVVVDTVERMQGKEAEAVIVCYGFLDPSRVAAESSFLFNTNRINVSLSRARHLCILIAGEAVLNAQLSTLWTVQLQQSYAHLAAFRQQSVSLDLAVSL